MRVIGEWEAGLHAVFHDSVRSRELPILDSVAHRAVLLVVTSNWILANPDVRISIAPR